MTEKRFERVYGDVEVVCIDHHKNGEDKFFDDEDYDKFVELLNALHEENQELKSKYSEQCIQLDFLKDENQHMRDLVNENEQLKLLNNYLTELLKDLNGVSIEIEKVVE